MKRIGTAILLSFVLGTALAADKAPSTGPDQATIDKARSQMSQLHQQMAQYYAAKTPEERDKIWKEHIKSMQEHMDFMRKTMEQQGGMGMMGMGMGMHGMGGMHDMGCLSNDEHDDDHHSTDKK